MFEQVLVTRPALQAREWVERLQAAGLPAKALPLIAIEAAADSDAAALRTAWEGLSSRRLVMFVSPNAASHFFDAKPPGQAWPDGVQAASPGPGTTEALKGQGVPARWIVEPAADAPQFDSESLWAQLSAGSWDGADVLVVRGTVGRDWLADRFRERGALVGTVAAYRRGPPRLDAAERSLLDEALVRPQGRLWFFSSSEAIDHLQGLVPEADWSSSVALATHPRIAARARDLGMGRVHETRPSFEAVVACIQSIAS
jgi:uroporphyrinogen-III synthase